METGIGMAISPARIARAETAAESYKRVEEEILALAREEVGRVTADVPVACSIALGALVNLEKLRPELEQLNDGRAAMRALDKLQDYALAAFFAHLQSVPDTSQRELGPLLERARPLRENLLKTAEALAGFGVLSVDAVSAIREGSGNLDMAKDLALLAALFESNWERVEGKVPFERALADEAAKLGPLLLRAIGAKEVGDVRKDPSLDWPSLRARAFRLLVNAYEELRRAASYVRWHHGDALAYAPSLHARAPVRRRERGDEPAPPAEPAAALVSERVELGGNAPAADAGLPGASPFSRE